MAWPTGCSISTGATSFRAGKSILLKISLLNLPDLHSFPYPSHICASPRPLLFRVQCSDDFQTSNLRRLPTLSSSTIAPSANALLLRNTPHPQAWLALLALPASHCQFAMNISDLEGHKDTRTHRSWCIGHKPRRGPGDFSTSVEWFIVSEILGADEIDVHVVARFYINATHVPCHLPKQCAKISMHPGFRAHQYPQFSDVPQQPPGSPAVVFCSRRILLVLVGDSLNTTTPPPALNSLPF